MNQSSAELAAFRFAEDKVKLAIEQLAQRLSLSGDGANGEGDWVTSGGHWELEHLNSLPDFSGIYQLKQLYADCTSVINVDSIACLSELEILDLYCCPISDLTPVGENHLLRQLDIGDTNVGDLRFASNLFNLEDLVIGMSNVTKLTGLEDCVRLKSLNMWSSNVCELISFEKHKDLTSLIIRNCPIDDLSPLIQLKNLQYLDIDHSQLTKVLDLKLSDKVRIGVAGRGVLGHVSDAQADYDKEILDRYTNAAVDEIYFYSPAHKYHEFSNASDHGFELDGHYWHSMEHYYNAMKFSGTAQFEKIRNASSPLQAQDLGHSTIYAVKSGWYDIEEDIVLKGLRAKFQNPELRNLLINTGQKKLIDNIPHDPHRGQSVGRGRNRLGVLLMQLREELK